MVQIGITTTTMGENCLISISETTKPTHPKYRKHFSISIPKLIRLRSSEKSSEPKLPAGHILDRIRGEEFSRLDEAGMVYLDYAGAALYPKHLLTKHHRFLEQHVLGNPHSGSPASMVSSQIEIQARKEVLKYFDVNEDEYMVVFTSNASGALKLVAEAYPFGEHARLMLSEDSHNSLHGMRTFAAKAGAQTDYIRVHDSGVIDTESFNRIVEGHGSQPNTTKGLLVFTAQSNVSGVKQDLDLVKKAHTLGHDTVIDIAALAATSRVSLRKINPSAAIVSFYKLFGYPTGIGALIMKKDFAEKLRRPYFGGGTVETVQVPGLHVTMADGSRRFEDGTINFLSLPAVIYGLQFMNGVIDLVQQRVRELMEYTISSLSTICYKNGTHTVTIHGAVNPSQRGGSLALTFHATNGDEVDCGKIDMLATKERISLRSGCLCNPAMAAILTHHRQEIGQIGENVKYSDLLEYLGKGSIGVVRISFGLASNQKDADKFVNFVKSLAKNEALD
ncbi:hypothetical protein INT44_000751 [Umbelopsis vinacea]|uniref:Aminotransferase class V domain-containing protein n=1 Tax=Umbelopsis vinacea TaxID=44442 RepID=A0A8H7UJ96_9FUNG|nr:hypothetical protein INT44_000751 [Umbelopsis vinacea]